MQIVGVTVKALHRLVVSAFRDRHVVLLRAQIDARGIGVLHRQALDSPLRAANVRSSSVTIVRLPTLSQSVTVELPALSVTSCRFRDPNRVLGRGALFGLCLHSSESWCIIEEWPTNSLRRALRSSSPDPDRETENRLHAACPRLNSVHVAKITYSRRNMASKSGLHQCGQTEQRPPPLVAFSSILGTQRVRTRSGVSA